MSGTLAVIGAGPKAAALAAAMASGADGPDELLVFEEHGETAAHWLGGHGYSDGQQLLCTDPERDVTFPPWPDPDVRRRLREFSWRAFLEETRWPDTPKRRRSWLERIDDSLAFVPLLPHRLHVPMLAGQRQGPAFPSLLGLGLTARRILDAYGSR